jgi:hypothetical protein
MLGSFNGARHGLKRAWYLPEMMKVGSGYGGRLGRQRSLEIFPAPGVLPSVIPLLGVALYYFPIHFQLALLLEEVERARAPVEGQA